MPPRRSKRSGESKAKKDPEVDQNLAIYNDGPFFKHWALYIADKDDPQVVHITGVMGHFRYEHKLNYDPQTSDRFHEMIYVGTIRRSQIDQLIEAAEALPIKQTTGAWNCQNWVLDLIAQIDGQLIEISQEDFDSLCGMMDGRA